jgi:hypothetical protein
MNVNANVAKTVTIRRRRPRDTESVLVKNR